MCISNLKSCLANLPEQKPPVSLTAPYKFEVNKMKRNIILALSVFMILGLAMSAFAFTTTAFASMTATSCCCCSGDSCPMKKKDATGKEVASCCDNCDCCKGDSCPMKKKGEKMSMPSDKTAGDKDCNCSCCHHDKNKEKADAPAA